jgi:hypothetical protein
MKLHGCFREAEVAGRGLEGAQPIQRWQQLAHRLTLNNARSPPRDPRSRGADPPRNSSIRTHWASPSADKTG